MRVATGAVYGTVAVILVATLISGPLVVAVDFTPERSGLGGIGQGTLTVENVTLPSEATLDRGFQSENYYLKAPDARLVGAAVTGRPIVEYKLEIPALNFTRATTSFLDAGANGTVELSLTQISFGPDDVSQSRYDGTVRLVARYDGTEQVLGERPITVEVSG
jgi:hypothetical protein